MLPGLAAAAPSAPVPAAALERTSTSPPCARQMLPVAARHTISPRPMTPSAAPDNSCPRVPSTAPAPLGESPRRCFFAQGPRGL